MKAYPLAGENNFMIHFPVPEALTFDDVLLLPARSDVVPASASTQTQLTRDLRFETRFDIPISKVMTTENLITVPVGTTLQEAEKILHEHRVEKLLVVDDKYNLKGLITVKDIQKKLKYPSAAKDSHGRLRVGAAIGASGDFLERAQELVRAKVDLVAIDSAHGHSTRVLDALRTVKTKLPELDVIVGNIATFDGACELARTGADAIKVGIGPGSICTTRVVTGAGVPQITAI